MEARDIIVRPLITEKSTAMMAEGEYVFEVAKSANKVEIAKAVKSIFKVEVERVNTINVRAKKKRVGRFVGKTRSYKKAIVKLADGASIPFFEG